jgi:hypothetical protein
MISSSQTSTEAPQLGLRGYRIFHFCPACGFRILYRACLTQMELGGDVSTAGGLEDSEDDGMIEADLSTTATDLGRVSHRRMADTCGGSLPGQ